MANILGADSPQITPRALDLALRDAFLAAHEEIPGCNSKCTNMVQCMDRHLKREFKATGYIRLASWDQFTQGSVIDVVERPNCRTTCIQRAVSKVWQPVRYDLIYCNCEHFPSWCCTGRTKSKQSDGALKMFAPDLHQALLVHDPHREFVTLPDVSPWENMVACTRSAGSMR